MPSVIIETDDDCELVNIEDVTELVELPEVTYLDDASVVTDLVESIEETSVIDVQAITEILDSCLVGPQGPQGNAGPAAQQINITVPVGMTVTADSISLALNASAKWSLTGVDTTNNLTKFSEVSAVHNGTSAFHSHYAHTGDVFGYAVNALVSGGLFFQLEITNHHTEDLEFKILRLSTVI